MRIWLGTILIFTLLFASAQSVPELRRIATANFNAERYLDAIEFYEKVVRLDKSDVDSRFNLAYCYFKTFQFEKATVQYAELIELQDEALSGEALFYYGTILKLEENYKDADSVFTHLIKSYDIGDYLLEQARKQKQGCILAMNQINKPRGFTIELMEDVNSRFHDFGATVNKNENSLVYVTTQNISSSQLESIQYSGLLPDLVELTPRGNGRWNNTTNRNNFDIVNSEWSEGSGSFTKDGSYFYFTSCLEDEGATCKIMMTKLENGRWSTPKALNKYINQDSSENKHPFITQSGDTLFFVSNRPGGVGGSDIWMSIRGLEEDSWTPAINMGDAINTPYNEITPYYSSAFECLLFASDGHVGYGGYDLFASKGESFFEREIYNLGYPFNSPLDDTYFTIQDSIGFLASNREDNVHLNLYSFNVSEEALYLSLLLSGESLIDSRIVSRYKMVRSLDLTTFRIEDYQGFELFDPVKRDKPKPKILRKSPFSEPEEEIMAANDSPAGIISMEDDYSNPENVIRSGLIKGKTTKYTIPYEKIYFNFGSTRLNSEAKISLEKLADQLKNSPVKYEEVEIHVHTDPIGSYQYNLLLSKQRGASIKKYLNELGIDDQKMAIYPEGEDKLVRNGNSWYEHLFNRRAEIVINTNNVMDLTSSYKLVVRNDISLKDASSILGVTSAEIKKWNKINSEQLRRGDIIRIEKRLATSPDIRYFLDEKDMNHTFFPYVIKEGETLQSIAKKFSTIEELLIEINHIEGNLQPGEELFIYKL